MSRATVVILDRDKDGMQLYTADKKPLIREIEMDFPIIFNRTNQFEMPSIKDFIPKIFVTDIVAINPFTLSHEVWSVFVSLDHTSTLCVLKGSSEYDELILNDNFFLHFEGGKAEADDVASSVMVVDHH